MEDRVVGLWSLEPAPAGERETERKPQPVRKHEAGRTWYRSDRVFCSNGAWYFHTREGVDVGPYSTQFDAEIEADVLMQRLRQAPIERYNELIRSHVLDAECTSGTLNSAAFTDYVVETGGIELLRKESQTSGA